MHIYFSGIGGTGIGPLALIAHQAGHKVSGSDKQDSAYIKYLISKGIKDIHIGQSPENIKRTHDNNPIDWVVLSSAVFFEHDKHPELEFAKQNGIRATKRDEFLSEFLKDSNQKLIAIAGTHGKTTTTAMMIWLMQHLGPVSYSVGAKIPFGDMGHYDEKSEYFVYECDEFDKNFLAFHPYMSLITGIDHDHHEVYPTDQSYKEAFIQFLSQSTLKNIWKSDVSSRDLKTDESYLVLDDHDQSISSLSLPGEVNRRDAYQVVKAVQKLSDQSWEKLASIMNDFPGVSRRFEKIADNLFSDYAHTIPKIKGCLQLASEVSKDIVIVYEPLTNRRQHFIRDEYKTLFKDVKSLYWAPSYLARENPDQDIISPEEFVQSLESPASKQAVKLDSQLKEIIEKHLSSGDMVICISGGGGGSLDEWVRKTLSSK